jgi:hypothetical protein
MKSNTLKLSLVLALSLAALAACDRHEKKSEAAASDTTNAAAATNAPAATTPATAPAPGGGDLKGKFKEMKLACADDLKKFCADADKPARCLKEHESDLSPGCNTAFEALKAARQAEKGD